MASIKLKGDTSGEVTIQAPAVAGTTTLNLPATSSTLATQNALGVRNLIINGDMRIAQRGTSLTSIAGSGYDSVDRFLMNINAGYANIASIQQNLNSISPPTDFTNYVGITIDTATTPDESASKQFFNFRHQIEQHIINHLNFGTANAKTITVSFWVRSSLTGTFAFSLRNGTPNRSYVTTYTINSADTWEKKTITINGDTTGTWNQAENVLGMTVNWAHGNTDPYLTSTINEWQDGSLTGYTGQVNLVETQNATWYITGVQLEVGDTATPFEHRPYDMELARCKRYYERITAPNSYTRFAVGQCVASTQGKTLLHFTEKRAVPSIAFTTASLYMVGANTGGGLLCTAITSEQPSYKTVGIVANVSSGLSAGNATYVAANNTTSAYIEISSEL
jgi:hypothetical protein